MEIVISGHNLPGRSFCAEDAPSANVHVGVQVRRDPAQLVPGDAAAAEWHLDIRVETDDDGALDFKGPAVQGPRGQRFLYLTWGDVDGEGTFRMFRRAKLMLGQVDPALDPRRLGGSPAASGRHRPQRRVRATALRPGRAAGVALVGVSEPSVQPPDRPAERSLALSTSNGRGLLIVATLADEWGADWNHGTKTVWAELSVTLAHPRRWEL